MPKVSVIVLDYKIDPRPCIDSLRAQTFRDFEIIVVDNNTKNRGFAGGCNEGIRRSCSELIALINNDATANRWWLAELVKAADNNPTAAGMFASTVVKSNGLVESRGCYIYPDGNGMCIRDSYPATFPSGCAAMYRHSLLVKVGFFDESFFMYNEDTDLGIRARRAGYHCVYVPHAIVVHKYSGSTSANSLKKLYWVERNRLRIMCRYFTARQIVNSFYWTARRYAQGGR